MFLVACAAVAVSLSFSGGVAIRYVLPVLWMTSRLPVIGLAKATQIQRILNDLQRGSTDLTSRRVLKSTRPGESHEINTSFFQRLQCTLRPHWN